MAIVTYSKLRDSVAGYLHRTPETFYFNGQDLLLTAINNAKNFAQRAVDFELAKVFGQLNNVSPVNGANIRTIVYFGTGTTFLVKSLKRAFLLDSTSANQLPIDFISREAYVQRLRRQTENAYIVNQTMIVNIPQISVASMQVGQTIYVVPATVANPSISLFFDAVEWLPDFTPVPITSTNTSVSVSNLADTAGGFIAAGVRIGDLVTNNGDGTSAVVTSVNSATSLGLNADIFLTTPRSYTIYTVPQTQTNFLLDYCFDYMLFRSIWELNYFLKEDARVQLSDVMMKEIWDNVIKWNNTIIANSTDDNDLN